MSNFKNFNLGVLGHVDSGKTTLCKSLSTTKSTAAFDSDPQSKSRKITLDLGFSSFSVVDPNICDQEMTYTLVDCPGHASLFRTVLGGAKIIDLVLLIIDINVGIQPQTSECLVLCQILKLQFIVVLTKVDLFAKNVGQDNFNAKLDSKIAGLTKKLKSNNFDEGSFEVTFIDYEKIDEFKHKINQTCLQKYQTKSLLKNTLTKKDFAFFADHCFDIKGLGSVFTGTVVQGQLKLNDTIEIATKSSFSLECKKVKSMQVFHKNVNCIEYGDRAGICVAQYDTALFERGIICAPNILKSVKQLLVKLMIVPFYKKSIKSKCKYHINFGCDTVLGKLQLIKDDGVKLDLNKQVELLSEINYETFKEGVDDKQVFYSIITLDSSVYWFSGDLKVVGLKWDQDAKQKGCRIAFHCDILETSHEVGMEKRLKTLKKRTKTGVVEKVNKDGKSAIVKDLFKENSFNEYIDKVNHFKVNFDDGTNVGTVLENVHGVIVGKFGMTGKIKVEIVGDDKQLLKVGQTVYLNYSFYSDKPKQLFQ